MIIAGGDSFVWGSELSDSPHCGVDGHSRSTFPVLLAEHMQYICTAYPGYSNSAILDSVIKECEKHSNKFGVIVSWSWPSRDNKIDSDYEIITLQEYLKTNDIPYMFTCADNCVITDNMLIDWTKWFLFPVVPNSGWHSNENPRGFYQWALENKYQLAAKDKHPLEQAHAAAAALMKEKFNELVKKNLE